MRTTVMLSRRLALCVALLGVALPQVTQAQDAPASVPARLHAEQAIRHLMMHTFDRPETPLTVDPVVVRGDHAVAGWTQGTGGGRALLARDPARAAWRIVLCAGDGLRDVAMLQASGVPAADARALAQALAAAEADLPAEQRTRFSSFQGVVHVDAQGHHGPAGAAHGRH